MTTEERNMLNRIHDYANEVMPDIDAQKTPVSFQLEKLKPIMEIIAQEKNVSVEDIFIQYMDLASIASAELEQKLQMNLNEDA